VDEFEKVWEVTTVVSYGGGLVCLQQALIKNNSHAANDIALSPFSHICQARVVTPTREAAADCVNPALTLVAFISSAVGILKLRQNAVFDKQANDFSIRVNNLALIGVLFFCNLYRVQNRNPTVTHLGKHSSSTKLVAKLFGCCHFDISCWFGQLKYTHNVRNVKGVS
jgi:hypothetical protein